jgi:hypothetical protein
VRKRVGPQFMHLTPYACGGDPSPSPRGEAPQLALAQPAEDGELAARVDRDRGVRLQESGSAAEELEVPTRLPDQAARVREIPFGLGALEQPYVRSWRFPTQGRSADPRRGRGASPPRLPDRHRGVRVAMADAGGREAATGRYRRRTSPGRGVGHLPRLYTRALVSPGWLVRRFGWR